jgi:hypothetical protein
VNASRAGAVVAIVLLACSCEGGTPGEYFVRHGSEERVVSVCAHGPPDVSAMRRRFDRAVPGLKGNGFPRATIMAALQNDGGVLIEYTGRTFHSRYLQQTGNWPSEDEPVTAEASLVWIGGQADPDTVYVESPTWKRGRRFDGIFFPASTPHDGSLPCPRALR